MPKINMDIPDTKRENLCPGERQKSPSRANIHIYNPLSFPQRNFGNQAMMRLLSSNKIQARLSIGQPGDLYEQEADRIADQVMRMPGPFCPGCEETENIRRQSEEEEEEEPIQTKPIAGQITPLVQKQANESEEEGEEAVSAKGLPGKALDISSGLESSIRSLRGSGQPLSEAVRSFFEPGFGYNFSQVRVHTDSESAKTAQQINAQAFTLGNDIVFAQGRYQPDTHDGKKLLAHELTHTIQQSASAFMPAVLTRPEIPRFEVAFEQHADAATASVSQTGMAQLPAPCNWLSRPGTIQREAAPEPQASYVSPWDKPNPYIDLGIDRRAAKIKELLDGWFTSNDILAVFQASKSEAEFLELEKKLDQDKVLDKVLDKFDDWEIVRFAALGPILPEYRTRVDQSRVDYLEKITREWGPARAEFFAFYMFESMTDDDAVQVLEKLGEDQFLYQSIDLMPSLMQLLAARGIDRARFKDRGWEWLDIPKGLGRGIGDILDTSPAAQDAKGMTALSQAMDLPEPYRSAVQKHDMDAFLEALSPGNVAFGAFDYVTFGVPSMVKGIAYDTPRAVYNGVVEISEGHVASGVEQLTGPTIFIIGIALGVRAYRRSKIKGLLELTGEGQALEKTLVKDIGKDGIREVAGYVRANADAKILVIEKGADAIRALKKTKGNVELARQEIQAQRAVVTQQAAPPSVVVEPPVAKPPVKVEAPVEPPVAKPPVKVEAPVEPPVAKPPVKVEAPVEPPVAKPPVKVEAPVEPPAAKPPKVEAPAEPPAAKPPVGEAAAAKSPKATVVESIQGRLREAKMEAEALQAEWDKIERRQKELLEKGRGASAEARREMTREFQELYDRKQQLRQKKIMNKGLITDLGKDLIEAQKSFSDKIRQRVEKDPAYKDYKADAQMNGIDEVSGSKIDPAKGDKVTVDHIVSIDEVSKYAGAQLLSFEKLAQILDQAGNLIAMELRANSSKLNRSWATWEGWKKYYGNNPEIQARMLARENLMRAKIKAQVEAAAAKAAEGK